MPAVFWLVRTLTSTRSKPCVQMMAARTDSTRYVLPHPLFRVIAPACAITLFLQNGTRKMVYISEVVQLHSKWRRTYPVGHPERTRSSSTYHDGRTRAARRDAVARERTRWGTTRIQQRLHQLCCLYVLTPTSSTTKRV